MTADQATNDGRPSAGQNPDFDALPVNPRGEAMLQELKGIHAMLRENLAIVDELALAAIGGAPADHVRQAVRELTTRHGLAALQVNCLYYCRFVHGHHGLEDAAMFPLVRAANPAVGAVVDRLEADHRLVADLLHAVETAAEELPADAGDIIVDAGTDVRVRVHDALAALAQHLLEHLAYEETVLAPTMRRMTGW